MGKSTTRHTLALRIGRLAGVIGVWILACVAPGAANTCEVRLPARRPPVEARQETATAARSRPRWTRSNDGELAANELAVYDATETNRTKEAPMEHAHDTDHARNTEDKESNMSAETNDKEHQSVENAPRAPRGRDDEESVASINEVAASGPQMGQQIIEATSIAAPTPVPSLFGDTLRASSRIGLEKPEYFFLMDHGQTVVILSHIAKRLLILRQCNLKKHLVKSAAALGRYLRGAIVSVSDDAVWIFQDPFDVIEVKRRGGTRRPTKSLAHLVANETVGNVTMLPGTRSAWVDTIGGRRTRLIDFDEEGVLCVQDAVGWGRLVGGSNPHKIFREGYGARPRVWSADGSSSIELEMPPGPHVDRVTVGLWGEGLLAARSNWGRPRGDELLAFDASGRVQSRMELPEEWYVRDMVTFPAEGRTLVTARVAFSRHVRLLWLRHGDHVMVLEAVHSIPSSMRFIQDPSSGAAAYVVPTVTGFWIGAVDPVHGIEPRKPGRRLAHQ